MKPWGAVGIRVLTIAGLAVMLASQQTPPPKPQAKPPQGPSFVKTVNTVPLVFLALDKHHHFVPGLNQSQIQVYDNNQLQKITKFDAEGNLPLRIALLLDISNSISTRWEFEQRAATDFLQSVLVEGRDQAMVVGFDTSTHLEQRFTDNYELLARAINSMRPSGGTALFDALYATARDDFGPSSAPGEVRNVIVIISDGADDQSRYSRDEALEAAEDAGAVIYTIGTEPTGLDPENDKVLQLYAEQTGGRSYFPMEARDLGTAFQAILTDLRHQYVVTYNPDNIVGNGNGEFHAVEVKVLEKGVTARTRKGYYAKPAPAPVGTGSR
ncbi:MAG TPA: VWA domain-containing protein [Terriglobales bacterium]|nr:VWA domain-containing protein [Terriglobales bacterium]